MNLLFDNNQHLHTYCTMGGGREINASDLFLNCVALPTCALQLARGIILNFQWLIGRASAIFFALRFGMATLWGEKNSAIHLLLLNRHSFQLMFGEIKKTVMVQLHIIHEKYNTVTGGEGKERQENNRC